MFACGGGRGDRREGRGKGSGGDGQPPPQNLLEDQSNVPVHNPRYEFTYFNPNQPQGRGAPSQPWGTQATESHINTNSESDIKCAEIGQNKGEEPTDIVLFSDTHQSRDPKTKGKWVDGKSQRKAGPALSERDMWVQANQDSKGRVYGFGSEVSKLKSIAQLSVFTQSSSVKNYDAHDIAMHFNESVCNQVEKENDEDGGDGTPPDGDDQGGAADRLGAKGAGTVNRLQITRTDRAAYVHTRGTEGCNCSSDIRTGEGTGRCSGAAEATGEVGVEDLEGVEAIGEERMVAEQRPEP
ncbi:hypothetical protein Cgig2_026119 [Carnegiea gigantea]|uniref:Uncharacterized protein n=1 Tax=Carnegiea gigantea TaxID=171969 RepID=A0A9Q1JI44_9CARY|nr:hypothetical protein Cgig2_026119 [Carnegiea gigantea]